MANITDKRSISSKIGLFFTYLVLFAFTLLALYPLVWLFLNSFKTTTEFQLNRLGFPKKWTTLNYSYAWVKGISPR